MSAYLQYPTRGPDSHSRPPASRDAPPAAARRHHAPPATQGRPAPSAEPRKYEIWLPKPESTDTDTRQGSSSRRRPPAPLDAPNNRASAASDCTYIPYDNGSPTLQRRPSVLSVGSARSGSSALSGATLCADEERASKKARELADLPDDGYEWFAEPTAPMEPARRAAPRALATAGRTAPQVLATASTRATSTPARAPPAPAAPPARPTPPGYVTPHTGLSRTMQYAMAGMPPEPAADALVRRWLAQDWPEFQRVADARYASMEARMGAVEASIRAMSIQAAGTAVATPPTQAVVPQPNAHTLRPAAVAHQDPAAPHAPEGFEVRACVQEPPADAPDTDPDTLLWCLAWPNGARAADGTAQWTVLRMRAGAGGPGARGVCVRAAMRARDAFPLCEFAGRVRLVCMRHLVIGVLSGEGIRGLERVAGGVRARTYGGWVKSVYHRAKEEGLLDVGIGMEQTLFAGPTVASA